MGNFRDVVLSLLVGWFGWLEKTKKNNNNNNNNNNIRMKEGMKHALGMLRPHHNWNCVPWTILYVYSIELELYTHLHVQPQFLWVEIGRKLAS